MGKGKRKGKGKLRATFRKKHESKQRVRDVTRSFLEHDPDIDEAPGSERVSGKGSLSRKKTVVGTWVEGEEGSFEVVPEVDLTRCIPGRVLAVRGLISEVVTDDNTVYECATRRLLKTLATDDRHVVVAGDRVMFRPVNEREGVIERVEPRRGVLGRMVRGRRHVIVANVDRIAIVASVAQPTLKPNLIDRLLVAAEASNIEPLICFNKIDLIEPAELQTLAGVYGQLGYRVFFLSATTGFGIPRLVAEVAHRQTVFVGQSGVGKSSLLNAIDPSLRLRVAHVSRSTEKGRHTTTTATLIPFARGGYLVDTPGIRQMQLWDVIPEELATLFREFRPYVNHCRFPDCTHTHELDCGVKAAVAAGKVDLRRYDSYCHLFSGD